MADNDLDLRAESPIRPNQEKKYAVGKIRIGPVFMREPQVTDKIP
jgi:hypothetical protein